MLIFISTLLENKTLGGLEKLSIELIIRRSKDHLFYTQRIIKLSKCCQASQRQKEGQYHICQGQAIDIATTISNDKRIDHMRKYDTDYCSSLTA